MSDPPQRNTDTTITTNTQEHFKLRPRLAHIDYSLATILRSLRVLALVRRLWRGRDILASSFRRHQPLTNRLPAQHSAGRIN